MARSDLIINLVSATSRGDTDLYKQALEAIIAEERSKQHHVLADKLSPYLATRGKTTSTGESLSDEISDLLYQRDASVKLSDLLLGNIVTTQIEELIEEHHRADLLRSYNLEPRHRILFVGSPGNGKTSAAEAIAEALMVPMFVVRYENLIGSYLGETAQRINKVIDFVRQRRCVLFFDEFDAVSKERGDIHETGEIKRVVNSLLLQLDSLPSHVTLIAASNHSELLDKAVWRRFQLKLELESPTSEQILKWFDNFSKNNKLDLKLSRTKLLDVFKGVSFSELKDFCLNVKRKFVLSQPNSNIKEIFNSQLDLLPSRRFANKRE